MPGSRTKTSNCTAEDENGIFCHCPLRCDPKVSNSVNNPGRIYYNCPKEVNNPERCRYFKWKDGLVSSQPSSPVKAAFTPSKQHLMATARTPTKTTSWTPGTGAGSGRTVGSATITRKASASTPNLSTPVTNTATAIARMQMTNRTQAEREAAVARRLAAINAVKEERQSSIPPTQVQTQATTSSSTSISSASSPSKRTHESTGSESQVESIFYDEEVDVDDSMEIDNDDPDEPARLVSSARRSMTPTTAMAPTSAKGKEKMRAKTLDEGYVVVNDQGSPTKRHKGQANVNKNLQEPEEGFFGSTPSRTLFTSSKSSDARNHSNDTPSKPSVATSKWNSSNAEPTPPPPPPPRTPSPGPGAPSTPSSTVSKTNAILASLHAFQGAVPSIEAHIQLLERRVTAGDRSCEARSKEIVRLKQEIKDKDETLERIWEENRDMKAKMLRQEKKIRSLEEELEHQKTGAREV